MNISQNILWAPEGQEPTTLIINGTIEEADLNTTRVAFSVPDGDEDIIIRASHGRLYRQMALPSIIKSSKPTLAEVHTEIFGNLSKGFAAHGIFWVPCAEPGYAISATTAEVKVRTVIPLPGNYPDLFSVKDLQVVKAEALEMALDNKLSSNVPAIINAPEIFVAEGAPVMRPTQQEKQEARAKRLEAALEVAAEMKDASAEELNFLLDMPR